MYKAPRVIGLDMCSSRCGRFVFPNGRPGFCQLTCSFPLTCYILPRTWGSAKRKRRFYRLRCGSGTRMSLPITVTQTFHRHVGVELRGGQRGVSKEFLDAAQVRAPVQEVGRRGVPQ